MSRYKEDQSMTKVAGSVAVIRVDFHFRLVAAQDLFQGTEILQLKGERVSKATRYSVQIGIDEHVDGAVGVPTEEALDLYPWRCLNHSCDPNAAFRGDRLIALRDVEAWEQITFDYNSTEFQLATPFHCSCKTQNCCGLVRGFRHLSYAQRVQREPILADYLRRLNSLANPTCDGGEDRETSL